MFTLVTYGVVIILCTSFFYFDGHKIVKNNVIPIWKNFRKINYLVSTKYKGFFLISWISIRMILQALWIIIIQYLNSSVVHIGGNKYIITYIIKGKTYKMIVKPVRGPKKIMLISDNNQLDVSSLVSPYLGPEEDFHGAIYTPKFFGREELVFELSNGDEKIFLVNDNIEI